MIKLVTTFYQKRCPKVASVPYVFDLILHYGILLKNAEHKTLKTFTWLILCWTLTVLELLTIAVLLPAVRSANLICDNGSVTQQTKA